MSARRPLVALPLAALLLAAACTGDRPDRLRDTVRAGGPVIDWDLHARPFPEIPFPNDVATRLDPTSPTGRRLNVSEDAHTEMERRFRRDLNRLEGFGRFSPITVSFDAPLDIADLQARQHDDDDPSNDGILVVRLGDGPACGGEGRAARLAPIDVGGGHYPIVLDKPCQYQFHLWVGDYICDPPPCIGDDSRAQASNLVFETVDEDRNGNGVLDPGEDTDFDGHLDAPNSWDRTEPAPGDADAVPTFYERQTDTLVVWPVVPLDEDARYAVVLTRHLKGEDGRPVESPFEGIAPATQVGALRQLGDILPCYGLGLEDVQFAWTFSTGVPTRELLALREGLYGSGPFAELAEAAPVESLRPRLARDPLEDGSYPPAPYTLPSDFLQPIMAPLSGQLLETPGAGQDLIKDAPHIDYWVVGDFASPDLLVDKDGVATPRYPDDQDERFELDVEAGRVVHGPGRVPFLCAIPKTTAAHGPPFETVLYAHGYSGATFEILGFAGRFAKAGFALCAIEAPGHGLVIPESETAILQLLDLLLDEAGLRSFYEAYAGGRVRDNDGDGLIGERDNGTDFWVADVFHTRDMVRQLAVDQMQLVRVLRAVDGQRRMAVDTSGDGQPDLLADFNGDGTPDLGGWRDLDRDGVRDADEPEARFYAWGQSLGGISSALLAAIEPSVHAAAPVSAAGGLVQVGIRSTNLGVPEGVLLPILGPFVTFAPHVGEDGQPDGRVDVGFLVPRVNEPARPVFHVTDRLQPGDRVVVRNERLGKEVVAYAPESLRFRVGIQADALRLGERRAALGLGDDSPLPVPVRGPEALRLGDPLTVEIHDGWEGPLEEVIDAVSEPYTLLGVAWQAGAPLVAPAEGLGYSRNSPDMRRLLAVSQTVTEPGDPAIYAPHIFLDPLAFPYETEALRAERAAGRTTRYLQYHTVGDADVPIASGLALARAAGLLGPSAPDPARGREEMRTLIDHWVVEGVEGTMRFVQRKEPVIPCPPPPKSEWRCPAVRPGEEDRYRAFFEGGGDGPCGADRGECPGGCPDDQVCFYDGLCVPCDPACAVMADEPLEGVLLDAWDVDGGTDRLILPEYNLDAHVAPTVSVGGGESGLRIPYMNRAGSHGVPPSIPERAFNVNSFVVNQIIAFFAADGEVIRDDPCLAAGTCDFLPWNAAE